MNVIDYFDPYNHNHLLAYQTLQETGMWPKGFLPEGIEIPSYWNPLITQKIADAWIKHSGWEKK